MILFLRRGSFLFFVLYTVCIVHRSHLLNIWLYLVQVFFVLFSIASYYDTVLVRIKGKQ